MLDPNCLKLLASKRIVLASGSPRRKEILSSIFKDIKFDIISSKFDEDSINPSAYKRYKDYALDLAKHKADAVYEELKNSDKSPDIVIGADTIVELNNRLFGKPKDENQAIEYLSLLNGKPHTVHTAVSIKSPKKTIDFVESTTIYMAALTPEVIKAYVETKDALDKAGAYAIQGQGGSLIERIEGDFYNVMGLPLHRFCVNLKHLLDYES